MNSFPLKFKKETERLVSRNLLFYSKCLVGKGKASKFEVVWLCFMSGSVSQLKRENEELIIIHVNAYATEMLYLRSFQTICEKM